MPNEVKKLSELVISYSNKLQLFDNSNTTIYNSWIAIVGEKLASHTKLIDIDKHTAIIETDHTGWYQHIMLAKKWIIRNFKKKYPQLGIERIAVVVSSHYHTKIEKPIIQEKESIQIDNSQSNVFSSSKESSLPQDIQEIFERLKLAIIEKEH